MTKNLIAYSHKSDTTLGKDSLKALKTPLKSSNFKTWCILFSWFDNSQVSIFFFTPFCFRSSNYIFINLALINAIWSMLSLVHYLCKLFFFNFFFIMATDTHNLSFVYQNEHKCSPINSIIFKTLLTDS